MPVLQINQQPGSAPNRYRISVRATEIPGHPPLSFDTDIDFELKPADAERIRWYLEDYLQFTEAPAPQIAAGIEAFMAECGEELFCKIFKDSDDATRLWNRFEDHLSSARIEVATGIAEATTIPWELIRDPKSQTFLALSVAAFVRSQREGRTAQTVASEAEKVRILLVISRPGGGHDVPFRSVASRLVTQLNEEARGAFTLHVLRPPTYEQLRKTLERAHDRGAPYHIVHFDGHGTYDDPSNLELDGPVLNTIAAKGGSALRHGFLAFENAENENNIEYVDGFSLGALLRQAHVPVLVLNACQSAFVEARPKPETLNPGDTRAEVEAYGSLAQAVIGEGAAGVVAMRYSVYVDTAAQFVTELYGALARGRHLGEAATSARRILHTRSDRHVAYEPRPLQDWSVPAVWERTPLRLWPEKSGAASLKVFLDDKSASTSAGLDQTLPPPPDFGFFGRDETLYALDRAFDAQRIVLLHAYAGSGKTSTAREFAIWYQLTGGVEGPVLFSSFERHIPLARVLDKMGVTFGDALRAAGVEWDAITDPQQRRRIALQVLQQVPVLWIWDNVEPVTGFPAGTASDWSTAEQQELRAFLIDARDTKAKFLLTSRRDETSWLGDLASRVEVPAMPIQERLQLAGAIAARRRKRLAELPDLRPLLRFTRGNPLTLLVTVGEALRAGIDTKARLDAFVEALRNGEVAFEDEEIEGRSKSLGASLSYGFRTAFSEEQRKVLALLHLFQGVVGVVALTAMGDPEVRWCLDAVRGLTPAQGTALLDGAVEIGLLNRLGAGYYDIHPALPWYFRALFHEYFPEATGDAARARSAFVESIGAVGNYYHDRYIEGDRDILANIAAEEDNLLAAWQLARNEGWWQKVVPPMQGLHLLYETTGRRAAWRRLVEDVIPAFVDPKTDGPLIGQEELWPLIADYRIRIARQEGDWALAERLQRMAVDLKRRSCLSTLEAKPETWDRMQRYSIRTLAVSVEQLGTILRNQGSMTCAEFYMEALGHYKSLGAQQEQAICLFNLGQAYEQVASMRDLGEAEQWLRKSLVMHSPSDTVGRAKCLGELGLIAFERFIDARDAKRPADDFIPHLFDAAKLYEEALDLTPTHAVGDRKVFHGQLGNIYRTIGEIDRTLHHYQQCIRYCYDAGDVYDAGMTRYNIALALAENGRLFDAREYAKAAVDDFRNIGGRPNDVEFAERLLTHIGERIAKQVGGQ